MLRWEKLPVSHESPLESVLGTSSGSALLPLWPLPYRQQCSSAKRVALPPYNLLAVPRQRNMAQMKDQRKTSERELNDEEIANLSDGEFKALVIKMLTDLTELGQKMKKQMKDTQNEIKQNIQGTNSDRKETRTHSNNLEQKKKK